MQIKTGTLSKSLFIRLLSTSTGLPVTNVEHDSAGIEMWYRREGGAKTTFTPVALASPSAAYASGGIEHISDGLYRVDVPNAMLAVGATYAHLGVSATGVYCEEVLLVELQTYTHAELYAQAAANINKIVHYSGSVAATGHTGTTISLAGIAGLPPSGSWRGCPIVITLSASVIVNSIIKDFDGTTITLYEDLPNIVDDNVDSITVLTTGVIPADVLEQEMRKFYAALVGDTETEGADEPTTFKDYEGSDVFTSTVDQETGARTVTFADEGS